MTGWDAALHSIAAPDEHPWVGAAATDPARTAAAGLTGSASGEPLGARQPNGGSGRSWPRPLKNCSSPTRSADSRNGDRSLWGKTRAASTSDLRRLVAILTGPVN